MNGLRTYNSEPDVFSPPTTAQVRAIADDIKDQIRITFAGLEYWNGGIVPSFKFKNYYAEVDGSGFFKKIIYQDGFRKYYFTVT